MLCAPIPDNEQVRLDTLRGLNILDSAAEERFDRITRLAKRLFGVSICLVSLVDSNRQWFKSAQGLEAAQTDRDISFCGHAIMQSEVLVIEDTFHDQRFADNPLVTQAPKIRFYAGYPLTMPNETRVGTLCIIDENPRKFSQDDIVALEDLGHLVEDELVAIQQSTLDPLTCISNRRGFEMLSEQVLANSDRLGFNTSLLFFDLDYFKEINDEYGHAEGDKALQTFAGLLIDSFRDSDVIARFGGDEFIVLLSHEGQGDNCMVLNRFEHIVAKHNAQSNAPYNLAYSVGIANRAFDSELTLNEYLTNADEAMFAIKQCHHQDKEISS
ncbi:sensor domain-containing diguanylate cyclase [Shewanella gaetbuli]